MVSGSRIASGAAWMMAARVVDRLVGVISTMILARLLLPADFGLVAMAMAVISLIELSNSFGFEVPLLKAKEPTPDEYNTVWTLNLSFGLFCAGVIAAVALPTASFYRDDRLMGVMIWLAVGWIIGSAANIGIVDFRRTLDFSKEFRFMMVTRLATFLVTIPCAFYFKSYWALIAGTVTGRVTTTLLSYAWHPYRPRLCLRSARHLFAFSVWIFVDKIASFGNARIGDFLLGRFQGPAAVGVYRMGEEIGYLPGSELVAPLNRALLPGAFRMADSGRKLSQITRDATGIVALVLAPACLGICAVAEPIVELMLGSGWLSVIPILKVLSINALVWALWANQHTLLFAGGHPKVPGLVQVLRLVLLLPLAFVLAPQYSGVGVAWAVLLSSTVASLVGFTISLERLGVPVRGYISEVWRPILSSIGMYYIVTWVAGPAHFGSQSIGAVLVLLLSVLIGAFAYTTSIVLLYLFAGRPVGAERLVLDFLWAKRTAGKAPSQ